MKKAFLCFAIVAAGLLVASCGSKGSGSATTEVVVPDGYKTYEFANFTISVPEEFTPGEEQNYDGSTTVRFDSERRLKLDDGDEYSSSATIYCGSMAGGATPSQIKETAQTMKLSQEATGETCDEPVIDGNIILMRHYHDTGEGYKFITWRWWIVSDSGMNISGSIDYPDTQSKYYDDVAKKIVKTIRIK